ncbi:MAG: hypothetical protein IT291_08065 [Deltaproteobacteria bacterium]|nr:hypothetical protein [Deltaproteobacteria bacterium]
MSDRGTFSPANFFLKDLPQILRTPIHLPRLSRSKTPAGVSGLTKHRDVGAQDDADERFNLQGRLKLGSESNFVVDDMEFVFDQNTLIVGELEIGALVRVKGHYVDGKRYASSIYRLASLN